MLRFDGEIIDGSSAYAWLMQHAQNVNGETSICSAYLKTSVLKEFAIEFPRATKLRVLVRWQINDLISGSSDLDAYLVCKELGWKFYVCPAFHGKIYHLPPFGILLGSANATNSGLGLNSKSNIEACTIVKELKTNANYINSLFETSYCLEDDIFVLIKKFLHNTPKLNADSDWPDSIQSAFASKVKFDGKLFISDCFLSDGREVILKRLSKNANAYSDLSLLGLLDKEYDTSAIAKHFVRTKIYSFLIELLNDNRGEIYFGRLTSAIHDALLQNPSPHRLEIKLLTANLYSWISLLGQNLTSLAVDQPNYSQRIVLIS